MWFFAKNVIFDQKKAPAASRQPEENGFGHFWPKKRRLRQAANRKKRSKNTKIGLKRVAVGAFWTSPIPKCTEKQDLQPRNGDIAPKPLKWRFKNDFRVNFFLKIFRKKSSIFGPMDTKQTWPHSFWLPGIAHRPASHSEPRRRN